MKLRSWLVLVLFSIGGVPAAAQDMPHVHLTLSDPSLRILQAYTLSANETARDVVVIAGDATIEGHVEGDVLVVLGQARLAGTAVVDGSLTVVGGTATIASGAQVHGDVFALGGLEAPPDFNAGGSQVAIGTAPLGAKLRGIVPWLTRGLLLGRPIVPGLGWVWIIAAIFFFINLLLNLLFDAPVRASTAALHATPVSAFVTGLLMLLFAAPLCVILAISVIGIAVIPFFICALILATIIGRVAFARWLGMSVVFQTDPASRAQSLRSFLIGSAIMCVAYVIPVLGLLTWAIAAVFGLGGATQAFARAYRRENPRPPRKRAEAASTAAVPAASEPAAETAPIDAPAPPVNDVASVPADAPALDVPIAGSGLLSYPRAGFTDRLAALLLDLVLVAIVAQVLRIDRLFSPYSDVGNNMLLLALAYHVGFWTWKQTTVGGIICQLRLVRTDGRRLGFAEALVRGLSGIFSLAVAGLGFFWILRDPERQAWHDRIAGTYVVKVPRDWPI
jgi:uncharacterized RDD family membrane protein YckC